ncbi:Oxaloacetate decarboxylase, gamma chain [Lachnospiraceae bacterium]|nr:Oxaloacetate decarboxylase, gamma chain [Lachnospiraceae bacterium]
MKKRLSKVLVLSMMLITLLMLSGCGEEEALNYEINRDSMQSYTQQLITQYYDTSEMEQEYYLNDGSELQKTAVSGFMAAQTTDHVGEFIDFATGEGSVDFTNGVDGKVVCSQICKYANRDVKVSISYKQNRAFELDKEKAYESLVSQAAQYGVDVTTYVTEMYGQYDELDMTSMDKFLDSFLAMAYNERPYEAIDCEVSAVYSKKELILMAGKNTAIGMGVVFTVLIFISFIISLLKYLPLLFDAEIRKARAEKKAAESAAKKQTEDVIIASSETAKEAKKEQISQPAAAASTDLMNDSELVAVITAAIYAASAGAVRGPAYTASNDKLVVRSIRRVR